MVDIDDRLDHDRRAAPHRTRPHGGPTSAAARSPFAAAAPSITLALLYAAALVVWLAVGDRLPGGRWLAVHLFTLGVLTNLVLTFSEHLGRTVTRTAGERARWWPLVTNAGVLGVLVGLPAGLPLLVALGGTVLTCSVFAAYLRLRRMRRQAVGARFSWIARAYERAHGQFVHGAVLGVLLGAGWVTGGWFGGVRMAHLHANVLGWGGLTLLATLVFFGPTMARTRIEPGADARAARAVRYGATGLTVGVLGLLAAFLPGPVGTGARLVAAAGLALLAWATTVVTLPVARAALRAAPTAPRWPVVAVSTWFPVVVWADAVVVAAGAWRWLDLLGVAALTAVLAQAIWATLTYLAPMLRGRTPERREEIRRRLETGAGLRAAVYQVGVGLVLLDIVLAPSVLPVAGTGWTLMALPLLVTVVAVARPGTGLAPRLEG